MTADRATAPHLRWFNFATTGVGVVGLVVLAIFNAGIGGEVRASSENVSSNAAYQYRILKSPSEIVVPSNPHPGRPPAASANPPDVTRASAAIATPDHCSLETLNCSSVVIHKTGRGLGDAVQKARIAGRNEVALCLTQHVDQNGCLKEASAPCAPDARLAGAMSYEQAQAWKALGCLEPAGRAVVTSIGTTPHGGRTWQMVCDLCNEISKAGHLAAEACMDCSWPELKTDELLKAEHAAMARRDARALVGLLSPTAFAIGIGASDVAVGHDAIEAQLGSALNSASTGPIKIQSKYMKVGRERSSTWIAEEVELVEPDGTSRHIAITQLAAHVGGNWTIVAMHWGVPMANDAAAELAARGDLPVPAPIEASTRDTAGLADALRSYLGSTRSVADAFADRDDAFNLGSAPGERLEGGPRIRRALGSLRAKMHAHDAIRVALGSSWDPEQAGSPFIGWGAANVDFIVSKAGKSVTQTYRLLAVLTKGATGWQIVQAHWSNAIPAAAPAIASRSNGSAPTVDQDAATTETPVAAEPPKPADPAKKLLADALAAAGGLEHLQKLNDVVITGKLTVGGKTLTVKGTYLPPDYGSTEIVGDGVTLRALVTPEKVVTTTNGKTKERTGRKASYSRAGVWRVNLLVSAVEGQTEARPQETVAGKPYDVLLVKRNDGSWPARVLLDPTSHRVFRVIYESDEGETVDEFVDYRLVNGMFFAFHQVIQSPAAKIEIVVDSVEVNVGIKKTQFASP